MVGIKDVAGKAGVSISTVSYVMSGKRPISPATRRRVLAAAREIGYVPAPGEHAARATRTHFVALSSPVHDSTSYTNYFTYFLHFLRQARFHGYETLLLTEENGGEQLARLIDTGLVDGVVLMDVNMDDSRLAVAAATGVPFVSIGLPGADTGIPCVDIDFTLMGGGIIDRLDRLGHSRIMFIGGKHVDYERDGGSELPGPPAVRPPRQRAMPEHPGRRTIHRRGRLRRHRNHPRHGHAQRGHRDRVPRQPHVPQQPRRRGPQERDPLPCGPVRDLRGNLHRPDRQAAAHRRIPALARGPVPHGRRHDRPSYGRRTMARRPRHAHPARLPTPRIARRAPRA